MKIRVTGIKRQSSRYGGYVYLLTGKEPETGRSFKCWIDPKNGNFKRWAEVRAQNGQTLKGALLGGLIAKNEAKRLIDADSEVLLLEKSPAGKQPCLR